MVFTTGHIFNPSWSKDSSLENLRRLNHVNIHCILFTSVHVNNLGKLPREVVDYWSIRVNGNIQKLSSHGLGQPALGGSTCEHRDRMGWTKQPFCILLNQ